MQSKTKVIYKHSINGHFILSFDVKDKRKKGNEI